MKRATTSPRRRELPPISPLPVLSANEVRRIRLSLGFTQGGFARVVGVTKRSLQHWEYGTRPVPAMLTLALRALTHRDLHRRAMAKRRKLERQLAESLRLRPPVKHLFY